MSAAEKINHIINEINNLARDKKAMDDLTEKLRTIDELVKRWKIAEDDRLYYEMVAESLKDVWDNDKDDAYNEL